MTERPYVCAGKMCTMLLAMAAVSLCVNCSGHSGHAAPWQADYILITKSDHTLKLLKGGSILAVYKVALGREKGPKEKKGDHRTPEGTYFVDAKNSHSRFHLALHLNYPNETDRQRARPIKLGPGGDIEIHGIENGFGWIGILHRSIDWTDGCIAVTDAEIEQIWSAAAIGTPVEIKP